MSATPVPETSKPEPLRPSSDHNGEQAAEQDAAESSAGYADSWRRSQPDNATQLRGEHWTEIINVNKLLCGYQIREDVRDIIRARYPAFTLRRESERVQGTPPATTSGVPQNVHDRTTGTEHHGSDLHQGTSPMTAHGKPQHALDHPIGTGLPFTQRIFVKTASGKRVPIGFGADVTVDDVKLTMQAVEETPPEHQPVLVFAGKQLEDGQKLTEYGIQKESTLHMAMRKIKPDNGPTRAGEAVHCIPEYEVLDASSIQIKETNSEFQQSLATNGFSSRCIEAGLSGGAYGVSAGVSSIWQRTKSDATQVTTKEGNREIHAVYNFPRVRVLLDEEDLVLSEKCKAELTQLYKDRRFELVQQFYRRFGHFFVTAVQLGGQQRTSKYAISTSSAKGKQQQDILKTAVGASVNAQFASVSAKYATERRFSKDEAEQLSTDLAYLGLSACGGNTLIGADIPRWANTLASHEGWRVIEQETVQSLPELIGKMPGWEDVPELFAGIITSRKHADRAWSGRIKLLWEYGPLKWDKFDGGALAANQNKDSRQEEPSRSSDTTSDPTFIIRNASRGDISDNGSLPELRADFPIHLSTKYDLQRNMTLNNQFTGVFVAIDGKPKDGKIKNEEHGIAVCRFSFRKHGKEGAWQPFPGQVIESGESVNLYCHSVGLGPFSDINSPPAEAALVYATSTGKLFVPISSNSKSTKVLELVRDYDLGTLSDDDAAAFEKMGFISDKAWVPSKVALPLHPDRWNLPEVSITTSASRGTIFSARFAPKSKKPSGLDYKILQTPDWKDRNLDWQRVRQQYYYEGLAQNKDDLKGAVPAKFTILFE